MDPDIQQYFDFKYVEGELHIFIKKEFVKTPHSNQQCFLVVPHAANNEYLLKNKGEMKIWYTADSLQIPIKIQQKMRHGVMELLLLDYYEK